MVHTCVYCGESWVWKYHRKFYRFPTKNTDRLDDWIRRIDVARDKISASSRLCSDHFEASCFRIGGAYKALKESAVPTIFGERKSACMYCSKTRDASEKRSLHKFPLQNNKLLQQWLSNVPKDNYKPGACSVLCSEHFERRFFKKNGAIKENAVPTIFNPTDKAENSHIESQQTVINEQIASRRISDTSLDMEELPSPKIHPSELPAQSCGSGMDVRAENEKPITSKTLVRTQIGVSTDHNYEGTPLTTRMKLMKAQKQIVQLKKETKVQKQRIKRMTSTISNLKDLKQINTRDKKRFRRDYDSDSEDIADPLDENVHQNDHIDSYNQKSIRGPNSGDRGDTLLGKVHNVDSQRDDHQIFGDYVASEFRSLRYDRSRRLLRLKIQTAILEAADIDNRDANAKVSNFATLLPASTSVQLKGHQESEPQEQLICITGIWEDFLKQ